MVEQTYGQAAQEEEFEQFYTDPNGVPRPRHSFHEQQYTWEQLREMKQQYLMENVLNCGYDATEFAQFMEYKMEGGTNVDNWEFEGLMNVVSEFQQHYQASGATVPTEEDLPANGENGDEPNASKSGAQPQERDPDDDSFEDITDEAIQARNQSNMEDQTLPKLVTRARAPTAKIVPTPINKRKVTLKVIDSEVRKGGFFSSDYVLYTLTTEPLGWKVGRKDSDFYTLRRILKSQFPHVLIPPLPLKSNKMTQKFLTKREKQFTRFLQAISRSEELKSSICLNNFLEIEDLKEFQKANKVFEKAKYGKSIVELVTEKGQVGVNMNQNAMVFCTRMNDFTDSYQILYQEIIETTREIKEKSADLAKTMHTLGEHLEKLGNVNYMIRVDRLHELYAWLSKMSTGTGNHIANLGDLFKVYLGSHLKYHMSEHESFRELYNLREQVKQNFIKKERHLIERKEKLYKSQDISRWGFEGPQDDLIRRKEELLQDKEKAFRYMLTKDSQELEHFREELFFYSNQSLSEVRRVGSDNGHLLTDHFITMSQIQCAYINQYLSEQHHVMWADFLSHFSEIGMVEGAEQYTIIKQRPPEDAQKPQAPSTNGTAEEHKVPDVVSQQAASQAEVPFSPAAAATASQSDVFINGNANNQQNDAVYQRRISRLDNSAKFGAALDAVKVDKKGGATTASTIAAQSAQNAVHEESEEEDLIDEIAVAQNQPAAEERKVVSEDHKQNENHKEDDAGAQEQAATSEPQQKQDAERNDSSNNNQQEEEQKANDEDEEEEDEPEANVNNRAAESGGDTSSAQQQRMDRQESAGGEQTVVPSHQQEAN